jgi:hypothetical protein
MTATKYIEVEDSDLDLGAMSLNDAAGLGGGWVIRFAGAGTWRFHDKLDCADQDPTLVPTPLPPLNETSPSRSITPTTTPTQPWPKLGPTPSPFPFPSLGPTHSSPTPPFEAESPNSYGDSYSSYSFSYGSAPPPAVDSCAASCPEDVLEAISAHDQTAACTMDLSCASECFSEAFANAHCACSSGMLFASYSYEFANSDAFCCSRTDGCTDAVQKLYRELLTGTPVNNASAIAAYLEEQCRSVLCSVEKPTSAPTPTPRTNDCSSVHWISSDTDNTESTKFDLTLLTAVPNTHDTLAGARLILIVDLFADYHIELNKC